jgi:cyclic 2,3-diphosphoglycerate synthetase
VIRALALVDGEHYPEVVLAAFAELPYEVVGAVFLGGTEKLRGRGPPDYGVPLYTSLDEGLERAGAELVLDLSDEPVVDSPRRFRLAAAALAAGLPYAGADFRLEPVPLAPFELPAVAVIGTGKRVGKTAVSGRLARLLAAERETVVVAMGRGGPAEPEVVRTAPGIDDLLALSRSGAHAASDHLEGAALAGVVTVGCRRCGGGLAGGTAISNVADGARVAAALGPDVVVFEGSGAAIPPVTVDARVLVVGAHQDPVSVTGYLGVYRLMLSDLVVMTMCEPPIADAGAIADLRAAIAVAAPELPIVATVLRPRPALPVAGRRVAYFTTAPAVVAGALRAHLEREHGADVGLVSSGLARREELAADLATRAAREAEVYLVELKAAAVDVVAETAAERGIEVVLVGNEVEALPGEPALDEALLALVPAPVRT